MPNNSKVNRTYESNAQRVMERIDILATHTALDYGVLRAYLTPEHRAAHQQLAQWMEQAGLDTWQDAAGNQWGRKVSAAPTKPPLIIGSHSDTVVNAGKYDGPLGVIMAIEALDMLNDVELPYHVDVVAFADEEGTRFKTTLLGSSAVAGKWNQDWFSICDTDGISIANAMQSFGLNPDEIHFAARTKADVLAYLEVHIEQGPLLESHDLAVGVVTAIAGAKRYSCTVLGLAGHAGTVPIHLRQDAFCATAEMALAIESHAKELGIVATVGRCEIRNSAVNVIPGSVEFTIDIRSQNQSQLEVASDQLLQKLDDIACARGVQLRHQLLYQAQAVPCSETIRSTWSDIVTGETGQPAFHLASGAGHDAMIMATITDIGMLFVRCEKGISHHPKEKVMSADVAVGLGCLTKMVTYFSSC
jgi:allantoate deiminase